MRPNKSIVVVVAVAFLLWSVPAAADMWGGDNIILAGILAEAMKQSVDAADALVTVKEALTVAKDSAEAARQAIQVVDNIALIMEDPEGFLQAEAQAFLRSFPEINDIMRDVEDVRRRLRPRAGRRYDPYAFLTVLEQLKKAKGGAYNIIVRAADNWGVSDPLDENIEFYREKHGQTQDILGQTTDPTKPISPQAASVLTAQSTAISAQAAVQANMIQTEMLRMAQMKFMADIEAGARTRAKMHDLLQSPEEETGDWRLQFGTPEGPL